MLFFTSKNPPVLAKTQVGPCRPGCHHTFHHLRLSRWDGTVFSTLRKSTNAFRKAHRQHRHNTRSTNFVEIFRNWKKSAFSQRVFVECWDTKQDFLADGCSKNEDVSEWPVCSLFDDKQHVGQGLGNWSKSLAVNLKEVELKCSYLNAFILGICNFTLKDTRHLRIELNMLVNLRFQPQYIYIYIWISSVFRKHIFDT